jgi:hypothetical protein
MGVSDDADGLGLRAFGATGDLELDALVLLQRTLPVRLDRAEMYEDVAATVISADEAIALLGVEPLHGSLGHVLS